MPLARRGDHVRGDLEQAELILLDGVELLERIGDRSYYPTLAVMLAHVLVNQQRFDVPAWLDRIVLAARLRERLTAVGVDV